MNLGEAKNKFICEWGKLCSQWGVNKTMGQIHALLLVSQHDLTSENIINTLQISQGNVNMNLRALEDWRLVERVHKTGERKDFFRAEKDFGKILKLIVAQRKKKELDPLLELLDDVSSVEPNCPESNEFCRILKDLRTYSLKADRALEAISRTEPNWISRIFLR